MYNITFLLHYIAKMEDKFEKPKRRLRKDHH